ncbi:MAG: AAA family ATPase [Ilumatobacteraceae bacterium]
MQVGAGRFVALSSGESVIPTIARGTVRRSVHRPPARRRAGDPARSPRWIWQVHGCRARSHIDGTPSCSTSTYDSVLQLVHEDVGYALASPGLVGNRRVPPRPGGAVLRQACRRSPGRHRPVPARRVGELGSAATGDRDVTGRAQPDDQGAVVEHLGSSLHGVGVLTAPAGSGTTYTLRAAQEMWEAPGDQVKPSKSVSSAPLQRRADTWPQRRSVLAAEHTLH